MVLREKRPVWPMGVGVGWGLQHPLPLEFLGEKRNTQAFAWGPGRVGSEEAVGCGAGAGAGTLTASAPAPPAPQPAPVFVTGLRPALSTTPLRWGC